MEQPNCVVLRNKAHNDYVTAKLIRDSNDELTGIICYHIQQYVEKMLKAKLSELGIEYKMTHDIEYLLELFPNEEFSERFAEEADRLTGYCVATRYDNYEPTTEEMLEAFVIADKIVTAIESIV